MGTEIVVPMCPNCGHFFTDDPSVGRAHAFLYGGDWGRFFSVSRKEFLENLEEAVLDYGNDESDRAAVAVAYALTTVGWPEAEDIQAAVIHHNLPGHKD